MRAKRSWVVQSFFTCFILNGLIPVVFCYAAKRVIQASNLWIAPFLQPDASALPDNAKAALLSLQKLLGETDHYLLPVILGTSALITLVLWLFVSIQGRSLADKAAAEALSQAPVPKTKKRDAQPKAEAVPTPEPRYTPPAPQAAAQMLSILQREGRLVDFLQEDLADYEDAQIGAAVRSIHQGCKSALAEHVKLEPVFQEPEGETVSVAAGFDAMAVRLTGNVSGNPPFRGILRHRGWRAARIELPRLSEDRSKDWVLAPAEVEVE